AVRRREQAEGMLRGEGTALEPGLYAFVDGNHLGGVGVVLVERTADGEPEILEALGLTVDQVFAGAELPSLATRPAIAAALRRLRNVLAALAALRLAVRLVRDGSALTVVRDYVCIGAWVDGSGSTKYPI